MGWPLAEFIYDPRSGIHIGPDAIPVILIQILLFATIIISQIIFNAIRRRAGPGFPINLDNTDSH